MVDSSSLDKRQPIVGGRIFSGSLVVSVGKKSAWKGSLFGDGFIILWMKVKKVKVCLDKAKVCLDKVKVCLDKVKVRKLILLFFRWV